MQTKTNRLEGAHLARLTAGVACAVLIAAFALAGTAAAHTVSLHKYSGTYPTSSIDGHDAVGTPGSPTFAGSVYDLDIDQASGALYAAVSNPEGVYKFNLAGASQPFSGLAGKTFFATSVSGDSDLEVDNSGTATQGRIYVFHENGPVKAFDPSGLAVAGFNEITGGDICGAAVSPTGKLWLGIYSNTVKEFNPNGTPTGKEFHPTGAGGLCDLEIDTVGNFYIPTNYGGGAVNKYNPTGEFVAQIDPGPSVRVPGVDLSNNDIFDDNQSTIRHYSPGGGSLISTFGGAEGSYPGLQGSNGIAIDKATHKVYVGNNRAHQHDRHLRTDRPDRRPRRVHRSGHRHHESRRDPSRVSTRTARRPPTATSSTARSRPRPSGRASTAPRGKSSPEAPAITLSPQNSAA